MRGRWTLGAAAVGLLVAGGWSAGAAPSRDPIVHRSFTILSEAYPEAPVPGRGSTELGAKPLGTRVTVSNAPASAYGRSALSDNGTIELYTGPPPPGTVSECDTTSTNLPRDAEVEVGGAKLTAHCADAPSADVNAVGSMASGGSGSSHAIGDGGGEAAIATAAAAVNDKTVGPVHIGSARYDASAQTDGTREGAHGEGHVAVTDATVAGIPVVIGPDGVGVDESKVPTELVPAAAGAVQKALGQGGYLNVRVAQPDVTIAGDGSSVEVRGGGVFFEGQSNDPTQPYFLRETLVGGSLAVSVGSDISEAAAAPPTTSPVTSSGNSTPPPRSATSSPSGVAPGAPDVAIEVISHENVHRMNPYGLGWLWVVAAAAVLATLATVFRRHIEPWWNVIADRYLRG